MGIRLVAAIGLGLWMCVSACGQAAANDAAATPVATNKAVLQPAIVSLLQTMDLLRVEKWKASKEVKAATTENIGSIRRDLDGTLPGLVTAADKAPDSLAALLPLARNVGALYDVAVRVTVIAESAAPGDQAHGLAESLTNLETARRTLADHMQQMAAEEEARVVGLQKQLAARPPIAAACPPAPVLPEKKTSAPKRRKPTKPAAKTPTPKPAGSGPS